MRLHNVFASTLLLLGVFVLPFGESANILAIFAFPCRSHSIMFNTLMKELLARGHNLTAVTNFHLDVHSPNYTAIDISPPHNFWSEVRNVSDIPSIYGLHNTGLRHLLGLLEFISVTGSEHVLRHPNVQRLIHNSIGLEFDLVLAEDFQQLPLLMFGHQFGAPIVSVTTSESRQYFNEMFGVFGAWSHLPHFGSDYDKSMTFAERVDNVWLSCLEWFTRELYYMPAQQQLADKYFGHLPEPRPTIQQLVRNQSLMLINEHVPLVPVRPKVPALIDVGGIHIGAVKPLPAEIKSFLDGATDGVIYFSLGTQLRSADMPVTQLKAFVDTFRKLSNIRILWKWEDESVAEQLSPNVMVRKWMPQNDILAHPNVRVFITHGGLFGSQEGAYHAVPMLGIPVYLDQHFNLGKAQRAGYAIRLNFDNVTTTSLDWALHELLDNPRYATEAQRVSKIFRDRPESPLDRAVYWIEYVIRHKGAVHLRSAALELSWFSYMLLDIVLFAVLIIGFVWVAVWMLSEWLTGYRFRLKMSRSVNVDAGRKTKKQ